MGNILDIRTMTSEEIRHCVVDDEEYYYDGDNYVDMKMLVVSPFAEDEDTHTNWRELCFVVPKQWLCGKLKECNEIEEDKDLENWLRSIYTTDESESLFYEALKERKVLMVELLDC